VLRHALVSLIAAMTVVPSLRAQAHPSDPSGTWTVSARGGAAPYGDVTITRNGECYDVTWSLADGTRRTGVGILVAESFAVAYGGDGSNGVVFYLPLGSTGFLAGLLGWWCDANGRMGIENLGPPETIAGAHPLAEGNSGTGTVTFTQVSDHDFEYAIRWETSKGSYSGFGFQPDLMLAGFWGSQQGGIAIYDLAGLEDGTLYGAWATESAQGEERLSRP
jgi:hypothetical protein